VTRCVASSAMAADVRDALNDCLVCSAGLRHCCCLRLCCCLRHCCCSAGLRHSRLVLHRSPGSWQEQQGGCQDAVDRRDGPETALSLSHRTRAVCCRPCAHVPRGQGPSSSYGRWSRLFQCSSVCLLALLPPPCIRFSATVPQNRLVSLV
jgi:hypothetical protein